MLVGIANREDCDQKQSDCEVCAVLLGCFVKQLLFEILEHLQ